MNISFVFLIYERGKLSDSSTFLAPYGVGSNTLAWRSLGRLA